MLNFARLLFWVSPIGWITCLLESLLFALFPALAEWVTWSMPGSPSSAVVSE
jgi:hypothetical protein